MSGLSASPSSGLFDEYGPGPSSRSSTSICRRDHVVGTDEEKGSIASLVVRLSLYCTGNTELAFALSIRYHPSILDHKRHRTALRVSRLLPPSHSLLLAGHRCSRHQISLYFEDISKPKQKIPISSHHPKMYDEGWYNSFVSKPKQEKSQSAAAKRRQTINVSQHFSYLFNIYSDAHPRRASKLISLL